MKESGFGIRQAAANLLEGTGMHGHQRWEAMAAMAVVWGWVFSTEQWPPKRIQIGTITMVYGTQITIVNGVYKPTYNWGAPSCMIQHKM